MEEAGHGGQPDDALAAPILDVRVESHERGTRISLSGELDVATTPQVTDAVARSEGRVELDLSQLAFIDSTGIRALMTIHREREQQGFVIRPGSDQVMRTIGLVGLTDVLPFEDATDD